MRGAFATDPLLRAELIATVSPSLADAHSVPDFAAHCDEHDPSLETCPCGTDHTHTHGDGDDAVHAHAATASLSGEDEESTTTTTTTISLFKEDTKFRYLFISLDRMTEYFIIFHANIKL